MLIASLAGAVGVLSVRAVARVVDGLDARAEQTLPVRDALHD